MVSLTGKTRRCHHDASTIRDFPPLSCSPLHWRWRPNPRRDLQRPRVRRRKSEPTCRSFRSRFSSTRLATYQSFIAVVQRPDDVTLDVTDTAAWKLADEKVAKIDGNRVVPLADGETELICDFGATQIRVPVKVSRSSEKLPISFEKDIVPIMTRSGCNTGSCHGAARGKDGFMISLFGYDPAGDYKRITREIGMRRINLAVPEDSLFLTKSTGEVPHTGGKLFDKESVYYKTILEWLQAGTPADPTPPPHVAKLEVFPPQSVIEGAGSKQRFIAVAHYTDGTTRDVTNLSAFMTNNETSAAVDSDGNVTAGTRGEAFIMARFETKTEGRQVLVLPKDLKYKAPEIAGNYIDQLVGKKLNQLRILPSGLCTDEEFLRRITIDITGQLADRAGVPAVRQ